jgi:hypothetical protein
MPGLLEIYGSDGALLIHEDHICVTTKQIANTGIGEGNPAQICADKSKASRLFYAVGILCGSGTGSHNI